jgi:CBS domain-containing membrane protein
MGVCGPGSSLQPHPMFTVLNVGVAVLVLGSLTYFASEPLLYPALGAASFIVFGDPQSKAACPRSALYGHCVAAGSAYLSLWLFGLGTAPAFGPEGFEPRAIGATTLAMVLLQGVLLFLDAPHPPAGATALIVSLGIIPSPRQFWVLVCGLLVLLAQATAAYALVGVSDYPLWSHGGPSLGRVLSRGRLRSGSESGETDSVGGMEGIVVTVLPA